MRKRKLEKPEDFIGWKSEDGKLEVTEYVGRDNKSTYYKVVCSECSKDSELFPLGYFVSTKGNLKKGQKPCGCSKIPKWKDWQYLVIINRKIMGKFILHGFSEEYKGNKTKINLECIKDGFNWSATISDIVSNGTGCPKCKTFKMQNRNRTPGHVALWKCVKICKKLDYIVVGFPDGYKNQNSRFEYICPKHGKRNVSYGNFVCGSRCRICWKDLSVGAGNGYYPERKDEPDFLYVLDFNGEFIKVGRSFDVNERVKDLKKPRCSGTKNIKKLRIFTATHQEIYDYEQELHSELRERNFQHYVDWSTECFENDSLFILNKLLDSCGLEEVNL